MLRNTVKSKRICRPNPLNVFFPSAFETALEEKHYLVKRAKARDAGECQRTKGQDRGHVAGRAAPCVQQRQAVLVLDSGSKEQSLGRFPNDLQAKRPNVRIQRGSTRTRRSWCDALGHRQAVSH